METDHLLFDRAVEIAISLEGAKLNTELMKSPNASYGTREVHHVGDHSSKPQNHSIVSSYRCGGKRTSVSLSKRSVTCVVELVTSPTFVAASPLSYTHIILKLIQRAGPPKQQMLLKKEVCLL